VKLSSEILPLEPQVRNQAPLSASLNSSWPNTNEDNYRRGTLKSVHFTEYCQVQFKLYDRGETNISLDINEKYENKNLIEVKT
jgi:hypothetical protein